MSRLSILYTIIVSILAVALMQGCSCNRDRSSSEETVANDTTDFYRHFDSMPDGGCVKMKINPIGGSLGRVFNDSNHIHLPEARALGITPVEGPRGAWNIGKPIVRIETCREFFVDNLTHSVPYLVPEAALLLKEIGHRFNDSLQARGGGNYRIKVTSVLRTKGAVRKLRRRNINATSESAHQFGTTFDVSYTKFICDSVTVARTQEDLKNLLGEVLKQLRDEKRCYVKYERKQGCFHITARRNNDENN